MRFRLTAVALGALGSALIASMAGASGSETARPDGARREGTEDPQHASSPLPYVVSETVVVTGSRTDQELLDAPVTLSVIPREVIATSPAANVAEVLRSVPGLNVIQTSAREWNVRVRGAATAFSQGTLVLLDGRPINEPNNGLALFDHLSLDMSEIAQIEVLHGPGSAAWGADALTGVVNLRTLDPRDSQGGTWWTSGGEAGSFEAGLRFADAPGDVFSYRVAAAHSEQDAWQRPDTFPDGSPMPAGFGFDGAGTRQRKFDARMDWDVADGKTWSLRTGIGNTSGLSITRNIPLYVDPSTATSYLDASYAGPMLEAHLHAQHVDGTSINALDGSPSRFRSTAPAIDLVAHRVAGKRHLLTWGGTVRETLFDADALAGSGDRTEAGVHFEDQMQLGEHVLLALGGRVDWSDTYGTAASPRAAIVIQPGDGHAIRLGWHRAYRPPTLLENFLSFPTVFAVELAPGVPFAFPTMSVGNPDLHEVRSEGLELGYTGQISPRHLLQAALYRVIVEDGVQLYPATFWSATDPPPAWPFDPALVPPFTFPQTFTYRNVGRVRDQGVEIAWVANWTERLRTSLSFTYQDESDLDDGGVLPPVTISVPPQHLANFLLTWSGERISGSFSTTWSDEAFFSDVLDARFAATVDDWLLVDGSLGVRLGSSGFELFVEVSNLLDDAIQQHPFGDILRRRAVLGVRHRFGPPRS